jgi:hypothetical protein
MSLTDPANFKLKRIANSANLIEAAGDEFLSKKSEHHGLA